MLSVSLQGQEITIKRLDAIKSPSLRKRVLNKTARLLLKASKGRATKQTDITGKPFGPYSDKSQHSRPRRRKMLTRLAARLAVFDLTDQSASVGWRNRFEEGIAAKHHFGHTQTVTKRGLAKEKNSNPEGRDAPATRQQAKALLEAGYKVRQKGKAYKSPTLKWITQNLTIGRAGLILRILRGGSKDSWQTKLPPRPFLGVTDADIDAVAALYKAELETALNGATA